MFLAWRRRWAFFVPLFAWRLRPLDVRLAFRRGALVRRLWSLDVRRATFNGRLGPVFARRFCARRALGVQLGLYAAVINLVLVFALALAPINHGIALTRIAII